MQMLDITQTVLETLVKRGMIKALYQAQRISQAQAGRALEALER